MPQTMDKSNPKPTRLPAKKRLTHIKQINFNADEAAYYLGISIAYFYKLQEHHPLYRPDRCKPSRKTDEEMKALRQKMKSDAPRRPGKKGVIPMWSRELLDFISFSWGVPQDAPKGTIPQRELEDDEAYGLWKEMREEAYQKYKEKAGY